MAAEVSLKHPFPRLQDSARSYYGGSQKLLGKSYVRRAGCGVVCAANILIYLGRWAEGCGNGPFAELAREDPIPAAAFGRCCDALQRRYMPVTPRFGLTGAQVAWGLNRYCRRWGIPYRMSWRYRRRDFWDALADQLEQDLPPVLAIGPNFPDFWGSQRLRLYRALPDASLRSAASVHSHFVSVTGLSDDLLHVSSWGREYFILRKELETYVGRHSAWLVSNAGLLRRV
ncbi:MAG: hypothetical protein IKD93_01145 [Firmicutes bacterium]|nr:hypothetical protein [Bacillota bacterium]